MAAARVMDVRNSSGSNAKCLVINWEIWWMGGIVPKAESKDARNQHDDEQHCLNKLKSFVDQLPAINSSSVLYVAGPSHAGGVDRFRINLVLSTYRFERAKFLFISSNNSLSDFFCMISDKSVTWDIQLPYLQDVRPIPLASRHLCRELCHASTHR